VVKPVNTLSQREDIALNHEIVSKLHREREQKLTQDVVVALFDLRSTLKA
jgi:hypothetical protein